MEISESVKGKQQYMVNAQRQEVMLGMMRKAIAALEKVGIQPVLLKGFGLARLYDRPYMREWGDIDLFVGKADYHKGAAALREAFPDAALFEGEEEYYKHYNLTFYKPFNTAIEMHRVSMSLMHPRDQRLYSRLESEGLVNQRSRYTNDENGWWEPEWKFNVLYVFMHSWEHWTHNSALMRQLEDLALLLTKGKPADESYEALTVYLKKNLKRLHLLQAWRLYAYILVHEYNVPETTCPLYDPSVSLRAQALKTSIEQGRECLPQRTAPKNLLLRKLHTFRQRVKEAKLIARYEPTYARHMVWANIAQSWQRFLRGENTRHWE